MFEVENCIWIIGATYQLGTQVGPKIGMGQCLTNALDAGIVAARNKRGRMNASGHFEGKVV
jgi:hypothetical protein